VGITAFGGYIPRLRMSRKSIVQANVWVDPSLMAHAKSERSMCDYDEDTVTMAVEAGRDCLKGMDLKSIGSVFLASTSLPFDDRQNSTLVAEALGVKENITSLDVSHSQRAATSGLIAALRAMKDTGEQTLFLASEQRITKAGTPKELLYGDGAAAITLGTKNLIARFLGSDSYSVDFVDHFRSQGARFDYEWEERWIREEGYFKIVPQAIAGALKKTGLTTADIDHFILPCVIKGVRENIAKKMGMRPESVRDNLTAGCGETGTAHPVLMLVDALQEAKPGEKILVVGFGQGADALVFEATQNIGSLSPRKGIKGSLLNGILENNYQKFLSFRNLVPIEWGMRAEPGARKTRLTALYRDRKMFNSLVGGKCTKCATIQFPKAHICVNPECRAVDSMEDYCLASSKCKIASYTVDWLAYTPNPPLLFGMIEFEEGAKFMTQFTGCKPEEVEVGVPMEMVFRIKTDDKQLNFKNYFWKATPVVNN
jgi:3-hydroxy-3-methylglutaryl CoA synthase